MANPAKRNCGEQPSWNELPIDHRPDCGHSTPDTSSQRGGLLGYGSREAPTTRGGLPGEGLRHRPSPRGIRAVTRGTASLGPRQVTLRRSNCPRLLSDRAVPRYAERSIPANAAGGVASRRGRVRDESLDRGRRSDSRPALSADRQHEPVALGRARERGKVHGEMLDRSAADGAARLNARDEFEAKRLGRAGWFRTGARLLR